MNIFGMHKLYQNLKSHASISCIQEQCYEEINCQIMLQKFSDMLCINLQDTTRKKSEVRQVKKCQPDVTI